jgi:hypothetical protein
MNPVLTTSSTHGRSTFSTVPGLTWRVAELLRPIWWPTSDPTTRLPWWVDGARREAARAFEVGIVVDQRRTDAIGLAKRHGCAPLARVGCSILEDTGVGNLDTVLTDNFGAARNRGFALRDGVAHNLRNGLACCGGWPESN